MIPIPSSESTATDDADEVSRLLRLPFITAEIAALIDRYALRPEIEEEVPDIGPSP